LTNENEKKEESKPSLAQDLANDVHEALTDLIPRMDDLMRQLEDATALAWKARPRSADYRHYVAERRAIATVWLVYYGWIRTINRENALLLCIEQMLEKEVKPTVHTELENSLSRLDEMFVKRISQLFDLKGHDAMYDTGTKPSRSN
jgi:hypothetical protein